MSDLYAALPPYVSKPIRKLELKQVNRSLTDPAVLVAEYTGYHSPNTGRDSTTLDFKVIVKVNERCAENKFSVSVDLGFYGAESVEKALAKMSEWLQRASEALKAEQEGSIPLFKS